MMNLNDVSPMFFIILRAISSDLKTKFFIGTLLISVLKEKTIILKFFTE